MPRTRALSALLLALGGGVSELVGVQAALADAPGTATLLHLASALLMGACVLARRPVARGEHVAALRALLLSLCAPVVGNIAVMTLGMPGLRRDFGAGPRRRAMRLRPRRDDAPGWESNSRPW